MKLKYLVAGALLLASPALAQPAQPEQSPPEVALQIDGIVNAWAQTLVRQGRAIEELQKQLSDAQARIRDLESKPKKDDPK